MYNIISPSRFLHLLYTPYTLYTPIRAYTPYDSMNIKAKDPNASEQLKGAATGTINAGLDFLGFGGAK